MNGEEEQKLKKGIMREKYKSPIHPKAARTAFQLGKKALIEKKRALDQHKKQNTNGRGPCRGYQKQQNY